MADKWLLNDSLQDMTAKVNNHADEINALNKAVEYIQTKSTFRGNSLNEAIANGISELVIDTLEDVSGIDNAKGDGARVVSSYSSNKQAILLTQDSTFYIKPITNKFINSVVWASVDWEDNSTDSSSTVSLAMSLDNGAHYTNIINGKCTELTANTGKILILKLTTHGKVNIYNLAYGSK